MLQGAGHWYKSVTSFVATTVVSLTHCSKLYADATCLQSTRVCATSDISWRTEFAFAQRSVVATHPTGHLFLEVIINCTLVCSIFLAWFLIGLIHEAETQSIQNQCLQTILNRVFWQDMMTLTLTVPTLAHARVQRNGNVDLYPVQKEKVVYQSDQLINAFNRYVWPCFYFAFKLGSGMRTCSIKIITGHQLVLANTVLLNFLLKI